MKKIFMALLSLMVITLAGCGGGSSDSKQSGVTEPTPTPTLTLSKIEISTTDAGSVTGVTYTPNTTYISGQLKLVAMGTYSDGSFADITDEVDWNKPTNSNVWSYDGVILTALDEGSEIFSATMDGVTSNELTATVLGTPLTNITISPSELTLAEGVKTNEGEVSAIATYSDGAQVDVTKTATWISTDTYVSDIIGDSVLGLKEGTNVMSAELYGITSDNTLTVTVLAEEPSQLTVTTDDVTLPLGKVPAIKVTATFNDFSRIVTNQVDLTSSDPTVIAFNDNVPSSLNVGTADISATSANWPDVSVTPVTVNVEEAKVDHLEISGNNYVANGMRTQLKLYAVYLDGRYIDVTDSAIWKSNDTDIVNVNTGEIAAANIGSTNVIASYIDPVTHTKFTDEHTINVLDEIASDITLQYAFKTPIDIENISSLGVVQVVAGASIELNALAEMTDGTQQNITNQATWTSSNNEFFKADSNILTGVKEGDDGLVLTVRYENIVREVPIQVLAHLPYLESERYEFTPILTVQQAVDNNLVTVEPTKNDSASSGSVNPELVGDKQGQDNTYYPNYCDDFNTKGGDAWQRLPRYDDDEDNLHLWDDYIASFNASVLYRFQSHDFTTLDEQDIDNDGSVDTLIRFSTNEIQSMLFFLDEGIQEITAREDEYQPELGELFVCYRPVTNE